VDEELAPYRGGETERIVVSGPAVFLQPASAQILALVLHELATNAAKYGALASAAGCVKLTWHLRNESLVLQWEEVGGPAVEAPIAQGYGTRVITASVERQMNGRASFDWRPDGLTFTMTAPLVEKTRPDGAAGRSPAVAKGAGAASAPVDGNRLLLIEDEALVGMMMKDTLSELGFQVIGPYSTVADATAAIVEEDFNAAILDVNLDGELAYPLADMVAARGVPFVFVTGYSADGIDGRYAHVPVLQKPIERQQLERMFVFRHDGKPQATGAPSFWRDQPRAAAAPR
jgi:CheY-like chemotaxis protein